MKLKSLSCMLSVLALTLGTAAQVQADQLADIKARGTLICGVLSTLEPFGFLDTKTRAVVGYDIDFCKGIAKHLGVSAQLRQISLEARIPELNQRHVDVLAAVLSYSVARAEQIDFTNTYYVSFSKMAVPAKANYRDLQDLAGKRISAVKGSTTGALVQSMVPAATLVNYDDAPSAFMALAQGKVEGFGLTEPMLKRFIEKLGSNSPLAVLSEPIGKENWGLGLKKNEPNLRTAVNEALDAMEQSGEAEEIFEKWMGKETIYDMTRNFKIVPM